MLSYSVCVCDSPRGLVKLSSQLAWVLRNLLEEEDWIHPLFTAFCNREQKKEKERVYDLSFYIAGYNVSVQRGPLADKLWYFHKSFVFNTNYLTVRLHILLEVSLLHSSTMGCWKDPGSTHFLKSDHLIKHQNYFNFVLFGEIPLAHTDKFSQFSKRSSFTLEVTRDK